MNEAGNIPDESEVKASTGRASWRIANGKICKGSEEEGTLDTREKIVGRLRRVGIHDGSFTRDNKTKRVYQLEADIETAKGMERVKASLCNLKGEDAPSGVAVGLLWGLLQFAKDELLVITASQGTKKNEFGSYSTFVNMFRLPEGKTEGVAIDRRPRNEGENFADVQNDLLKKIKQHPAFADRPASDSDDDEGNATTHLSALGKECAERGWPTPDQKPGAWLKMMAGFFKLPAPKAALSEHDDHEWGEIRLAMKDLEKCPNSLLEDADRGALV